MERAPLEAGASAKAEAARSAQISNQDSRERRRRLLSIFAWLATLKFEYESDISGKIPRENRRFSSCCCVHSGSSNSSSGLKPFLKQSAVRLSSPPCPHFLCVCVSRESLDYTLLKLRRSCTGHEAEPVLLFGVFELRNFPLVPEQEHWPSPPVLSLVATKQLAVLLRLVNGFPAAFGPSGDAVR